MTIGDKEMKDDAENPSPKSKPVGVNDVKSKTSNTGNPEEDELDEALEETFPASDPIAPGRTDGPKKAS